MNLVQVNTGSRVVHGMDGQQDKLLGAKLSGKKRRSRQGPGRKDGSRIMSARV